MPPPRLILIGNYAPDQQASMRLFGEWIAGGMQERGWQVETVRPPVRLAKGYAMTTRGIGKWMGYLDKFVLFRRDLARVVRRHPQTIFHIVDHSNAAYARHLPRERTVITCHDVLAIEGAFGDPDAFCPASRTGVILQKWILKHLKAARRITFVSENTRRSLSRLPGEAASDQEAAVIPNGINQRLERTEAAVARARLEGLLGLGSSQPFYLHVGSSLPRKNRVNILRAFRRFLDGGAKEHRLVFAGKALSFSEKRVVDELDLRENLTVLVGISSEAIEALYNTAEALVFPSYSEGFGWPIIEAQSCGCPVICSDRSCLPEVAGKGALLCDPASPESIEHTMKEILVPTVRARVIAAGSRNVERFHARHTLDAYAQLFASMQAHEEITGCATS